MAKNPQMTQPCNAPAPSEAVDSESSTHPALINRALHRFLHAAGNGLNLYSDLVLMRVVFAMQDVIDSGEGETNPKDSAETVLKAVGSSLVHYSISGTKLVEIMQRESAAVRLMQTSGINDPLKLASMTVSEHPDASPDEIWQRLSPVERIAVVENAGLSTDNPVEQRLYAHLFCDTKVSTQHALTAFVDHCRDSQALVEGCLERMNL